jgi:hypothetical protein
LRPSRPPQRSKPSDIIALQTDLAKEITAALRMHLTRRDELRMAKTSTAIPEAYQDYLRGRYFWNKRIPDMLKKGIESFQQAIAKDPAYARAYSGVADCYTVLAVYGSLPAKEAFPKAKEAALRRWKWTKHFRGLMFRWRVSKRNTIGTGRPESENFSALLRSILTMRLPTNGMEMSWRPWVGLKKLSQSSTERWSLIRFHSLLIEA